MAVVVLVAGTVPAAGGNIASYGTGIMGSNDAKRPMITYVAEASSSLGTWSADGLEVVVDDATTLRVRDSVPVGEGTPQRFLRVRVQSAPLPP